MNVKKTQEFLYFQNKARHYANLKQMKPMVKTRRGSAAWTASEDYNHKPYFKRYDMQRQNEGLINRITDIMTGPRYQIQKHGYTRYNPGTARKSHFTIQQKKMDQTIEEDNQRIAHKVLKAKPSIGTIDNWNKHFRYNREIRSNISKYTDKRTSKGTLEFNTSRTFVPAHYRSFLNRSVSKKKSGDVQEPTNPEEYSKHMKIKVEELFQLPKLKKLRGSFTKIGENGDEVQNF